MKISASIEVSVFETEKRFEIEVNGRSFGVFMKSKYSKAAAVSESVASYMMDLPALQEPVDTFDYGQ